jgi:nicotinamide-nucleotide amidase
MAEHATQVPGADSLAAVARRLAEQLSATGTRLVLAESCTGGLAAAALTAVPGISAWFCGSAVTYRELTKVAWLDVSPTDLVRVSAVSGDVTRAMATGVLQRTAEAHVAAAVTGHLGPDAPADADGRLWVALAERAADQVSVVGVHAHQLAARSRRDRQQEAAAYLLAQVSYYVSRRAH